MFRLWGFGVYGFSYGVRGNYMGPNIFSMEHSYTPKVSNIIAQKPNSITPKKQVIILHAFGVQVELMMPI